MTEQEPFEQSSQDKQFLVDEKEVLRKTGGLAVDKYAHKMRIDDRALQLTIKGLVESCRVPILHPEKIRAMIGWFEERGLSNDPGLLTDKETADLLRFILGQEQETWKPEDFGLVPKESEGKEVAG